MIRIDLQYRNLGPFESQPQTLLQRAARLAALRMAEEYVDAMHEWVNAGRSFTPRTGHLEQSIGWRPEGDGAVIYANAAYAPDIEFGTRPHLIRPKPGRKALRWFAGGPGGGQMIRRSVRHPGTKRRTFFFADLPARKGRMLAEARAALAEVLERA